MAAGLTRTPYQSGEASREQGVSKAGSRHLRAVAIGDPDHSDDGSRLVTVGYSARGRLLVVCHVDRGGATRLISARRATARERKRHEG